MGYSVRVMQRGVSMIESLEQRRLLSAVVQAGILRVEGTAEDDLIRVDATATRFVVIESGVKQKFSRSGVTGIFVDAGLGNDRVDLRDAVLGANVKSGGGHD